jgi:hypothetical protein
MLFSAGLKGILFSAGIKANCPKPKKAAIKPKSRFTAAACIKKC